MSKYSHLTIGILATQGDFQRHQHQLELVGARSQLVKLPDHLDNIDGLILPGGESTTMNIMIDRFKLREPLTQFCRLKPVYGTCAGMIMLARKIEDNQAGVKTLGIIDIDVVRTGYGRQLHSFEDRIDIDLGNGSESIVAAFIRAPRVTRIGKAVETVVRYKDSPVLVKQEKALAGAFHAELDDDTRLLEYFLSNNLL